MSKASFPSSRDNLLDALSVSGTLPCGVVWQDGKRHRAVTLEPSTDGSRMKAYADLYRLGVRATAKDLRGDDLIFETLFQKAEMPHRLRVLGDILGPAIAAAAKDLLDPDINFLMGLIREAGEKLDRFCEVHEIDAGPAPGPDEMGDDAPGPGDGDDGSAGPSSPGG